MTVPQKVHFELLTMRYGVVVRRAVFVLQYIAGILFGHLLILLLLKSDQNEEPISKTGETIFTFNDLSRCVRVLWGQRICEVLKQGFQTRGPPDVFFSSQRYYQNYANYG